MLDLAHALVDVDDVGVADELRDLVLLHVAVAAVQVQPLVGAKEGRLGGGVLRQRRVHPAVLIALLDLHGRLHEGHLRQFHLFPHGHERFPHDGHVAEPLAELLALAGVLEGEIECPAGKPHADGGHHGTGEVEDVDEVLEALAAIPDDLALVDDNILEGDGCRVGEVLPEFFLGLADDDPAAAFCRKFRLWFCRGSEFSVPEHLLRRHDAAGQELRRGLSDLAENGELAGVGGVGDEALGAVEDVFPVGALRDEGAHGRVVRAGAGFREAKRGQKGRLDIGAQVFFLLPGVTVLGDDGVGQVVAHGRGGYARIAVGELLDDQGRRHGVHLETFDLLGDAQVENAQLPGLRDNPEGELVRLVDLQDIGEDLVFHETPDRVDVHLLLFIEAKIHAFLLVCSGSLSVPRERRPFPISCR